MTPFGFLVAWVNAPFAIAAGIAILFAVAQVTGALGWIAGGGDADHDADVDHDVDHDADSEHADHERGDGGARWGAAVLAPLGIGKIPLSLIWQVYAVVFAATGFGMNLHYLGAAAPPPLASLAWSVPVSLAAGYVAVAIAARVLGPVLSSNGQEATRRAQLVGQAGVVISSQIDENFGEVRIRDKTGHDVRVICKVPKGSPPLVERRNVVVVDYDEEREELLVEALDDDVAPSKATSA